MVDGTGIVVCREMLHWTFTRGNVMKVQKKRREIMMVSLRLTYFNCKFLRQWWAVYIVFLTSEFTGDQIGLIRSVTDSINSIYWCIMDIRERQEVCTEKEEENAMTL